MAFVYRAEKLKKPRPNTALGPGQYLPITETKLVKSNEGRAPFESSVKKFNTIYGESSKTKIVPGPGKYYQDPILNLIIIIEQIYLILFVLIKIV